MKFSEMPYQRPNLDEIKAQFAAVTQRFAAAPDYAAAKAAFEGHTGEMVALDRISNAPYQCGTWPASATPSIPGMNSTMMR